MKNVTSEITRSLNYKDMKTLNEIDKIRRGRIIITRDNVNKQFDGVIELLMSCSNKK